MNELKPFNLKPEYQRKSKYIRNFRLFFTFIPNVDFNVTPLRPNGQALLATRENTMTEESSVHTYTLPNQDCPMILQQICHHTIEKPTQVQRYRYIRN